MAKIKRLYENKPVGADGNARDIIYPITVAEAIIYGSNSNNKTNQSVQEAITNTNSHVDNIEVKMSEQIRFSTTSGDLPTIDTEDKTITFKSGSKFIIQKNSYSVSNVNTAISLFPTISSDIGTVPAGTPYYLIFDIDTRNISSIPAAVEKDDELINYPMTEQQFVLGVTSRDSNSEYTYHRYIFNCTNDLPDDITVVARKYTGIFKYDICIKEVWFDNNIDFIKNADAFTIYRMIKDDGAYGENSICFAAIHMNGYTPEYTLMYSPQNLTDNGVYPLTGPVVVGDTVKYTTVGYCVIDWELVTDSINLISTAGLELLINPLYLNNNPIISNYLRTQGYKDITDNRGLNSLIKEIYTTEQISHSSSIEYKVTAFNYDATTTKCTLTISEYSNGSVVYDYTDTTITPGEVYKFTDSNFWVFISNEVVYSSLSIDISLGDNPATIVEGALTDPLTAPICYINSLQTTT